MDEESTLLIIGYSFSDEHIEEKLKKKRNVGVINVNNSNEDNYPHKRISNQYNLKKSITDL